MGVALLYSISIFSKEPPGGSTFQSRKSTINGCFNQSVNSYFMAILQDPHQNNQSGSETTVEETSPKTKSFPFPESLCHLLQTKYKLIVSPYSKATGNSIGGIGRCWSGSIDDISTGNEFAHRTILSNRYR